MQSILPIPLWTPTMINISSPAYFDYYKTVECWTKNVLLRDTWLKMEKIPRFVLLILCLSIYAFAFYSNTKFVNKGFVNYDINNHVFKEFQMFGGREMANCSQECILENECTGFELCKVDSSQLCRLTNDSPNPKPSLDISAHCRHFIKVFFYVGTRFIL